MERNPENIDDRSPFELKPASCKLATIRALGAIAIRDSQGNEPVCDQTY
jgi:hypothetical protein